MTLINGFLKVQFPQFSFKKSGKKRIDYNFQDPNQIKSSLIDANAAAPFHFILR